MLNSFETKCLWRIFNISCSEHKTNEYLSQVINDIATRAMNKKQEHHVDATRCNAWCKETEEEERYERCDWIVSSTGRDGVDNFLG